MKPPPLIAAGTCEGLGPEGFMVMNGQNSPVTRQVRRCSEGTNCLEAQASKGKVGHTVLEALPRSPKETHFAQLWGEPTDTEQGESAGLGRRQEGRTSQEASSGQRNNCP